MKTARFDHTATLLPNGKVLVAGGSSGYNRSYNSAELYDPATGTWSYTDNTMGFRGNSSAALLQTGEVLVAGARGAAIYKPGRHRFVATGTPVVDWGNERLTLLLDGRVLMTGGINTDGSYSNRWQLYDPSSRSWVIFVPYPMTVAHSGHISTRLPDGTVLVAGGLGYDGQPETSAELFFPY